MISVDAYSILAFSNLTCNLEHTGISAFDCSAPPDSKESELGNSDQEASPSAGKNTGVFLVPSCAWKFVPTAISGVVDISAVPGYNR